MSEMALLNMTRLLLDVVDHSLMPLHMYDMHVHASAVVGRCKVVWHRRL